MTTFRAFIINEIADTAEAHFKGFRQVRRDDLYQFLRSYGLREELAPQTRLNIRIIERSDLCLPSTFKRTAKGTAFLAAGIAFLIGIGMFVQFIQSITKSTTSLAQEQVFRPTTTERAISTELPDFEFFSVEE